MGRKISSEATSDLELDAAVDSSELAREESKRGVIETWFCLRRLWILAFLSPKGLSF